MREASPPMCRAPAARSRPSDLASFRAHLREPLKIPYRGGTVFATPELTAGPTLAHALRLLQQNFKPGQRARRQSAYTHYAEAIQAAYRERLKGMGDAEGTPRARRRISRAGLHHALSRWSIATATWRR